MIDVPIGVRAGQWVTVAPERTVLVVAHNITTMTRLLDVLSVFDSDFRVQVVVSWSGSDPFHRGLRETLDDLGIVTLPWSQAIRTEFDLAIAASHHAGFRIHVARGQARAGRPHGRSSSSPARDG